MYIFPYYWFIDNLSKSSPYGNYLNMIYNFVTSMLKYKVLSSVIEDIVMMVVELFKIDSVLWFNG